MAELTSRLLQSIKQHRSQYSKRQKSELDAACNFLSGCFQRVQGMLVGLDSMFPAYISLKMIRNGIVGAKLIGLKLTKAVLCVEFNSLP